MVFFSVSYTNFQLSVTLNFYLSIILKIAISLGVIWLFYNLSGVFAKYLTVITDRTENKLDDQLVPLIRKSLRFFVVTIGVILILQNNGYNVASLIAGLGIGGLAVALAARDTLANFLVLLPFFLIVLFVSEIGLLLVRWKELSKKLGFVQLAFAHFIIHWFLCRILMSPTPTSTIMG